MLPAHQRLDAGHRAGAHRDLGLVEKPQLIGVERAPDARAHDDPLLGRAAVDFGEEREAVAPGILRAVHRDVGLLEQRRRVVAVVRDTSRCRRCADRRHSCPSNVNGSDSASRSRCANSLTSPSRVTFSASTMNSSPPRRAAVSDARIVSRDPLRHDLQHLVAGQMAERVVDVLEAVEVDEQHGEHVAVPPRDRQRVVQPLEERAAVVETRQRVVVGEAVDVLLGELLLRHFAPDAAIAGEATVASNTGSPLIAANVAPRDRMNAPQHHVVERLVRLEPRAKQRPAAVRCLDFRQLPVREARDAPRRRSPSRRRNCR